MTDGVDIAGAFVACYGEPSTEEFEHAEMRESFFRGALYVYQLMRVAQDHDLTAEAMNEIRAELKRNLPEITSLESRIADKIRRRGN